MTLRQATALVKTDPNAAFDLLLGKTAADNAWGAGLDKWMEATLTALVAKGAKNSKVEKVIDAVYKKGDLYYRARLLINVGDEPTNLNFHLEFTDKSEMLFALEWHHKGGLDRVAEVRADPFEDAVRSFNSALAKALKDITKKS